MKISHPWKLHTCGILNTYENFKPMKTSHPWRSCNHNNHTLHWYLLKGLFSLLKSAAKPLESPVPPVDNISTSPLKITSEI